MANENSLFFPSCVFTSASPQAAKKLQEIMAAAMPVAGCCRTSRQDYPQGTRALYFCQACRGTLGERSPQLTPENLFVWWDRESGYPLPDYSGLTVSVQDCWRDREHPEIHQAVRSLLGKMGIKVLEIPENREKADYCGTLHYVPERPEAQAILRARPDTPLVQFPPEEQKVLFAGQVEKHGGRPVLCYCNRCKAGIEVAGGKAVHLMELVMGTYEGDGCL